MKKVKKHIDLEYRILNINGYCSIIKVFLDSKRKIVGYTDYIVPVAKTKADLKLLLTKMIISTRKDELTEQDLKSIT